MSAAGKDPLAGTCIPDKGRRSVFRGNKKYSAYVEVLIHASPKKVWEALVNPALIGKYLAGARVTSDWKEGSPISWKGEWEGKPYDDRGTIRRIEPERVLQYSHYSALPGSAGSPENFHLVTIVLTCDRDSTRLSLSQDNNLTPEARDHSHTLWERMLNGLKDLVENDPVRKLFAAYEKAFSALELEKNAGLFADTFISAGPRGTIAQSRDEFLAMAHKAAGFYRAAGLASARILSLQESPVSNEYALVKIRWGVTFAKTGDRMIEFDVSYLVQKTGPEPKIIVSVSHQDEEQAMKDPGLLPETPAPAHRGAGQETMNR